VVTRENDAWLCFDALHSCSLINTNTKVPSLIDVINAKSALPSDPPYSFGGVSVGEAFGFLTVVRRVKNQGKQACWECSCDCGNTKVIRGERLRRGAVSSCGCDYAKAKRRVQRTEDLIDRLRMKNFGRLYVLGVLTEHQGVVGIHAVCLCRYCGDITIKPAKALLNNKRFRGCDCPEREPMSVRFRRYGYPIPVMKRVVEPPEVTRLKWQHASMISRCECPTDPAYLRYGARGISVCDRWQSFEAFHADVGVRPANMTLERINNDGPYSPENCVWATPLEQTRNRRNTKRVEWQSKTLTLAEFALQLGITYNQAYRQARKGKSPRDIADWAAGRIRGGK